MLARATTSAAAVDIAVFWSVPDEMDLTAFSIDGKNAASTPDLSQNKAMLPPHSSSNASIFFNCTGDMLSAACVARSTALLPGTEAGMPPPPLPNF